MSFFTSTLTLNLGKLGTYTITPQAKLMFISYTVLLGVMFLSQAVNVIRATGPVRTVLITIAIINLILYPLFLGYATYVNNCLVVGNCNVLAWVIASVGAFFAVMGTVLTLSRLAIAVRK